MIRAYFCPACDGAGAFLDSPSGWANDPSAVEWECTHPGCDGTGVLQLDPASDDADGLRPYTPSKRPAWSHGKGWMLARYVDPLVELARCRAINPRSASYRDARHRSMRPVPLTRVRTTAEFIEQDVQPILDRYVRRAA